MDKYTIKITSQAIIQLRLIMNALSLYLKDSKTTNKFLDEFKSSIESLTLLPNRIKCIDEKPFGELGFRRIRVKNYYIYFYVYEKIKRVYIIAIVNSKRNQNLMLRNIEIPQEIIDSVESKGKKIK